MRRNPSQFMAGPRGRGTTHSLRTVARGAALFTAAVAGVVLLLTAPVAATVLAAAALLGTSVGRAVSGRRRRQRQDRTSEFCVPRTEVCVET